MSGKAYRVFVVCSLLGLLMSSSAAVWAAPTTEGQATGATVHIVQWGENLGLIAARYGVSASAIAQANGIANHNLIYAGQSLTIPGSSLPTPTPSGSGATNTTTYVVRSGDTLSAIAYRFGATVNAIVSSSGIVNPNLIFVGQTLKIPTQGQSSSPGGSTGSTCVYVVQAGDNLTKIALKHGTSVWSIAIANNLANPSFIWVGQRLAVPNCSSGGGTTPTAATPTPAPQPNATVTPGPVDRMNTPEYGAHTFLWWSGEHRARDAQLVKDAGLTWAKEMFPWRSMEGAGKGIFDWSVSDQVVQALSERGLKIIARVDSQPAWSRAAGANNGPPDNYRDYGDFVFALANRYKGKIQAYEIWNEPNLAREWGDRPPNAAEYVALLRVAYLRIKEADPDAVVITAGLAPTGTGLPVAVPDVQFLREMYAAGAKGYFDVLGVHAPGYKAAPEISPDEAKGTRDLGGQRFFCFRHVEDLRQVMVDNGDTGKQIAVLEFGWTSDSRAGSPYAWHAVTEETKAQYVVRAFQWARDHWSPWMGAMTVLSIANPSWTQADEQYWWSITNPDGTVRPAYEALKAAAK